MHSVKPRGIAALLLSLVPALAPAGAYDIDRDELPDDSGTAAPDATVSSASANGTENVSSAALDEVVVTAGRLKLIGNTTTASEGVVVNDELALAPVYRPGQLLETVPGLVATTHSGEGRPISTCCAATTWITAQTSQSTWTRCPSTSPRMHMVRGIRI